MKTFIPALLGVVLFCTLTYFPDPFFLLVFVIGGGLWIGLPLIVIGIIVALISKALNRSTKIPICFIATVLAVISLGGLSIPANSLVYQWAEIEAKAYPDKVRPLLDDYRKEHGVYPKSLDELQGKPPVPRLFKAWSYRSNGSDYSFSFPQPGGLIDQWDYDSKTRKWSLST